MLCIMFITVWQGLGYYMMMYLAGLQSIPKEIVEPPMWTAPRRSGIFPYQAAAAQTLYLVLQPELGYLGGGRV